jgi:hypothetical protein
MKNIIFIGFLIVFLITFSFAAPQQKEKEDYMASCHIVKKLLGRVEKNLLFYKEVDMFPYRMIEKILSNKRNTQERIERAEKIGPTKKGYQELNKAFDETRSLATLVIRLHELTLEELKKELEEFEKKFKNLQKMED